MKGEIIMEIIIGVSKLLICVIISSIILYGFDELLDYFKGYRDENEEP